MMFFILFKIRTCFWTIFYRVIGKFVFKKLGKGCIFEGWIDFPQRGSSIEIGDYVRIGRFVEISVLKSANLKIGSSVFIGRSVLINVQEKVAIGDFTLVAEHSSIYDNDHVFHFSNNLIRNQGMRTRSVEIGSDVWIGAKCVVLSGSRIPNGCVLGSNTLFTRKFDGKECSIILGVPGRVVGNRHSEMFKEATGSVINQIE